ncbi:MAG: tRNA 2-selenouridine(34) synthase MnmH [Gammaproteobacteria bacterium]|nr:tRNA 2-selenouridine(34) synthase MnmH [Gammaproteobacteria bacterium]MDE0367932.1 tRNA 2-selenouridine(34) synthase MnmH [Gammaproteobacteria bacterium]
MTPNALLANDVPLIDLRAPGEFARGAFPGSVNLPLLTDAERHEVGLAHKRGGAGAAIAKGHELVCGAVRAERTRAWAEFAGSRSGCWLYCWRGGLRSRTAQSWLREEGVTVPRVAGGYKALRRACLDALEEAVGDAKRWLVLAGRTGSGKTRVIGRLANAVDLEGLACHRGSAFGARPVGQPTPVAFENALAAAYLKHDASTLVLEDESRTIGRLALPAAWHERMGAAPLVLLEATTEERVGNIRSEYVEEPLAGGVPPDDLHARLAGSLDRIRKRLGGDRHARVGAALDEAFRTGSHEAWIRLLLDWYYDPMYDYQLAAKRRRVVFQGGMAAVTDYLSAPTL